MTSQIAVLLISAVILSTAPLLAQDPQSAENNQSVSASTDQQAAQNIQAPEDNKKENPPEPESHGTRLRWQDIPRNVLHDEKAVFLSPFHINRENAKWWLLLGGGTAALIATDQKFSDRLPQTSSLTNPSKWASRIGADYTIFPLWGTFYVVGKLGDRPRARDTGRLGIEALIDADITANVVKLVTQRPRPEVKGDSVGFFQGGDAFPSGHSIKAWALARVAAREYSDTKWVPVLAYSAATAVSVARVGGRRHSPSDALAGAAMGFFIGEFVYAHHHAPTEKVSALTWVAERVNFSIGAGR
jgi:membrane-associated phospholipid phosphatase